MYDQNRGVPQEQLQTLMRDEANREEGDDDIEQRGDAYENSSRPIEASNGNTNKNYESNNNGST